MRQELQFSRRINLLICIVVILLGSSFIKCIFIPQYSCWRECETDLIDLQAKYSVAREVAQSLPQETALTEEAAEQLNEYKKFFDNKMDDGMVFVYIDAVALESRVEIVSIMPATLINKGAYVEFPLRLETRGNYQALCDFLYRMENFSNPTAFKSLKVTAFHTDEEPEEFMAMLEIIVYAVIASESNVPFRGI